jgi:hypothetical protein
MATYVIRFNENVSAELFKTIVSKGTALIYDPYYAFVYLIIMLTLLVKKLLLFKISAI